MELHPSPNVAPENQPIALRTINPSQPQPHPAPSSGDTPTEGADSRLTLRMSSSEADYFSRGATSTESTAPKPSKKSGKKPSALADASVDNSDNAGPRSNEHSPLLSPAREEDGFMDGQTILDDYDEFQTTKSIWYLILLTISIGGLQIAWSVELSNGSPFLLSLGLSKSLMALVWIAGPLSGTLVQPYVGMLSDNCRVRWGKRKPFMLGGAAATICSLLCLAWTREFVGGFLSLFGADPTSNGVKYTIIVVAVLWVYILDFAINTGRL